MSKHESEGRRSETAPIFAALGDPTRLEIVGRLSDGRPRSITQLTEGLDLTRQAVTKHLHRLEHAGLVTASRIGRERRFELRPEPLVELRSYLDDVSRQWDETLDRLKTFVEGRPRPLTARRRRHRTTERRR